MSEVIKDIRGREPGAVPLELWVGIIQRDNGVVNRHCLEEKEAGWWWLRVKMPTSALAHPSVAVANGGQLT
jgi:hypothetical protein